MEIRPLNAGDNVYAISRIYAQSRKDAYKGLLAQSYLDGLAPDAWAERIVQPERHVLVVLENGAYIGTASYGRSRTAAWPDFGEIFSMYLLPEHTGKGYGTKLMSAVLDELAALGYQKLFYGCWKEIYEPEPFMKKWAFSLPTALLPTTLAGRRYGKSGTSIISTNKEARPGSKTGSGL